GPLPFFEGWLVPDTADFLLQTPPPTRPDFDEDTGAYAWHHAQTLPLDTQDELSTAEEPARTSPPAAAPLDTGRIAGDVNGGQTDDFVAAAIVNRTPFWLMGLALAALLITLAAIFWPRAEQPAPAADADLNAAAKTPETLPIPSAAPAEL